MNKPNQISNYLATTSSIPDRHAIECTLNSGKLIFSLLDRVKIAHCYIQIRNSRFYIYAGTRPDEHPFADMDNIFIIDNPQLDTPYYLPPQLVSYRAPRRTIYLRNDIQAPAYYSEYRGGKLIFDIARDGMVRLNCLNGYADTIAIVPSAHYAEKVDLVSVFDLEEVESKALLIAPAHENQWVLAPKLADILTRQCLLLITDPSKPEFIGQVEFWFAETSERGNDIYLDSHGVMGNDIDDMNASYLRGLE